MLFHCSLLTGMLFCPIRCHAGQGQQRGFKPNRKALPILLGCVLGLSAPVCKMPQAAPQPALPVVEQDHDEKRSVRLNTEQIAKGGIRLATATAGSLAMTLNLPGIVTLNADKRVQVVPRVAGVVREVGKSLGDRVRAGDILAVIDSRELADARAAYLAAKERSALALATFQRKEDLLRDKATSRQAYQEAQELLTVAKIEEHTARQKLLSLGLTSRELSGLTRRSLESSNPGDFLSRYEITAPFAGDILARQITLGAAVEPNAVIFELGDLNTVWADLQVYPKDLARIRKGQTVTIGIPETGQTGTGKIIHVQPVINEETRRTFARVELDNRDGRWLPGLFVNGWVQTGAIAVSLRIARSALQDIGNETIIFVPVTDGFEPHPVQVGRGDENNVEILGGLKPDERYVETGGFILKSELQKSVGDDDD